MAAVGGRAGDLALEVRTTAGATKQVSGSVALATETWPMRTVSLPYNRVLVDLQEVAKSATSPAEIAATRLNLAIVHMGLGNWDDALAALGTVRLPDGSGVSAGTVAYLTGLCHEALANPVEAQAAFKRAAASPEARLSQEGPLVAPLAQRKLQGRR